MPSLVPRCRRHRQGPTRWAGFVDGARRGGHHVSRARRLPRRPARRPAQRSTPVRVQPRSERPVLRLSAAPGPPRRRTTTKRRTRPHWPSVAPRASWSPPGWAMHRPALAPPSSVARPAPRGRAPGRSRLARSAAAARSRGARLLVVVRKRGNLTRPAAGHDLARRERLAVSASRRRYESPSMAMTSAWWTTRSMRAVAQAALGKMDGHSANGRFVVRTRLLCS